MTSFPSSQALTALVAAALLAVSGAAQAAGGRAPNVLLVIADDLGVDKVGAYAADVDETYASTAQYLPETPTLDLLAESGVRFTDAWANPACSPTRASLYTGRYAMRHGVGQAIGRAGADELDLDETTIARVMSDAGYVTGLFGKWHLGEGATPVDWSEDELLEDHLGESLTLEFPTAALGWDLFNGTKADLDITGWEGYYDYMTLVAVPRWGGWVAPSASSDYATQATTATALAWIDKQSTPWFATVAYHAPHTPFQLPPEGCGYDESGEVPTDDAAIYKAMVECMDEQMGVLLDGIVDLQNTVVLFVGDNGTEEKVAEGVFADERGKGTVYESGVRVPLIVADGYDYLTTLGVPGLGAAGAWNSRVSDPNRTVSSPVHVVDLFSTIGALGGGDTSTGVDGENLMPLLANAGSFERGPVLSEVFGSTSGDLALRSGDYKLVVHAILQGETGCRSRYELYNIGNDRLETTDLFRRTTVVAEAMSASLEALISTLPGSWMDIPDCGES
jgi:arylsulfatase A-like enzyme